jgi:hypothetical protein
MNLIAFQLVIFYVPPAASPALLYLNSRLPFATLNIQTHRLHLDVKLMMVRMLL